MKRLRRIAIWFVPLLLSAHASLAGSLLGPLSGQVVLGDHAVHEDVVVRLSCTGHGLHGGHQTDHELRVIDSREAYRFLWAWRGLSPIGCGLDVLHPLYRQAHIPLEDSFWQRPDPIALEPWARLLEGTSENLSTADLYRHLFYLRHSYLAALGDDASSAARHVPELHAILGKGLEVLPPMSADRFGSMESALDDLRQIEDITGYQRPEPERALFTAATSGDSRGVAAALARGAATDAWNRDGRAALHLAAEAGHTPVVLSLLEAGARIDLREEGRGRTPVLLAMQYHRAETVLALVENGADVTLATRGTTPLMAGCSQGMSPEVLRALLEAGAIAHAREPRHVGAAIRTASQNGRTWIVRALVEEEGVSVDAGLPGWTGLMGAARYGKLEAARYLIDAGANVNARTPDGRTALSLARAFEREEVVELLLDHGALDDTVPTAPLPSRPEKS